MVFNNQQPLKLQRRVANLTQQVVQFVQISLWFPVISGPKYTNSNDSTAGINTRNYSKAVFPYKDLLSGELQSKEILTARLG